MSTGVLFPSSLLKSSRVDEHFTWQAEVAKEHGIPVALADFYALACKTGDPVLRLPRQEGSLTQVIYRGWMLTPEVYTQISDLLAARDITLLTSAQEYERAVYLPGWYEMFAHLTPKTVWFPKDTSQEVILASVSELDAQSYFVKDYMKSRKHEFATAAYAGNVKALPKIIKTFIKLQGEDLAGGVVVRAWEDFDYSTYGETRIWWVSGHPVVATPHPDSPQAKIYLDPEFLHQVGQAVNTLGCPFVTTDVAQRTDGQWRVIEVSDGGVSDFPAGNPVFGELLDALVAAV